MPSPLSSGQKARAYERQREWVSKNRPAVRKYFREYYAKNRVVVKGQRDAWYRTHRNAVLDQMGGACACCGEPRKAFLQIDHIVPCGGRVTSTRLLRDVINSGYDRTRYRVLCANCNFATRYFHACPHNEGEAAEFLAICQQFASNPCLPLPR